MENMNASRQAPPRAGLAVFGRRHRMHGRDIHPGLRKMNAGGADPHPLRSNQEGEDMRCNRQIP
jgi:hypothetical protein